MQKQIFGCVEGAQTLYLATFATIGEPVIYITRDDLETKQVSQGLSMFAPDIDVVCMPAWDCLPYDRLSPHGDITGCLLYTSPSPRDH